MLLYNTVINKDLAAMTLIYFILDITCQWVHLQAATYHRGGMVPPAPPLLTLGKRTSTTHSAALTRAKTETGTVASLSRIDTFPVIHRLAALSLHLHFPTKGYQNIGNLLTIGNRIGDTLYLEGRVCHRETGPREMIGGRYIKTMIYGLI